MDEQTGIRTHKSQDARLADSDHKEKRLRFYAATVILALLVPFGALASATRTLSEAVMTDQQVYPAGAPVHFSGLNFVPGLGVTLQMTLPDGSAASIPVTSDADGKFEVTYQPPMEGQYSGAAMAPGGIWLTAIGFSSGPTLYPRQNDFLPGQTVGIYGELWQPGETVLLVYHEQADPPIHPDHVAYAVADADGNIHSAEFLLDESHRGLTFTLTASGQSSGIVRWTTFTDSAATDCFRTAASGAWNAIATWESAPAPACSVWSAATLTPTSAASTITILSGHTVHVTANVIVDQVVIDSGGDLEIDAGVTLTLNHVLVLDDILVNGTLGVSGTLTQQNTTTGSDVEVGGTGTLHVFSGGLINGSGGNVVTRPSLTIDSGGQWTIDAGGSLNSGGNGIQISVATGATATLNGPVTAGTTVTATTFDGTVTASANITVNSISNLSVGGTFTMTAGTLTVPRGNGGSVGEITSGGSILLQGSSVMSIGVVNTAHFDVLTGGTLDMGPNALVNGTGFLLTQPGANLVIGSVDGITNTTTTGNVRTSGNADVYDVAANYTYAGVAAQTTGNALPTTVNNLTIANTGGAVTPTSATQTVSGTLTVEPGAVFEKIGPFTLTLGAGGVVNDGTIRLHGNVACGGTDNILLRSTAPGTQRAWSGAGTFDIFDASVQDQAGSAAIIAYSSTNAGNNGANWTITSSCLVAQTLTLSKTWVNGATGDTATVTSTGFTNNATSGASVSSGNNTTTGSAVIVTTGESGTISESFSVGSAVNYTAVLACTGNNTPLSGNTLTINVADTAIVCTITNTRKSATLTLAKTWVNGAIGDTATVTSAGFTNNATSGASVSSGNNTTTGSSVTVFAGENATISELFSVGSAANYTAVLACTGNGTPLAGSSLTINPADTAIVCTFTNTRKSATLTLAKTWVNGAIGDTATVTSTGFTNNATSGASVSSGNNTTTGSSVTVFAGESGTISELFSVGSAANYTAGLACTGNGTPLAGSSLTINPADTAIVCTFTNTRKSATLTLAKTWVNGAVGDTATVISAGFTNGATSGASVSSGNNTTTGSAVGVAAGESGTIGESFSVGSAANYTAVLACTGNTTPLSGNTLTINAADTAIVCTFTNTRKSATLTLAKTWVNGAIGDTATVTSTGFTNNATSGASVSSGNNTTTGSSVTVFVGESGTISELFSVGSAANYTPGLACTGNGTPLAGSSLTINPADTAITCTFTNTRKSATLTLAKTWVNGASGDTATVTSTGFTNNATSGASVSSGNNTTTGSSVTVFVGESGTISELFSVGSAANYTAGLACTGNGTPLAGSSLTINPADTAITCTFTNTRKSATLTLAKTWVNGAIGDTATVTSTGFTNNATSGASVSSGNNTTTGSSVTVFVGESGTISELFSVGSAANYTPGLACTGNGTPLAGSSLTINPADTAITCTFTNTRKSATLTLAKTWVNGAIGDTATVTSTGFTNNATSGASVSSGNNTTTGSSVTVFAGASGTISESFSVGTAANYNAVLACTGNGTPLAGGTLTINPADTAIVCTFTNARGIATLTLRKTWVNGASGDTATVTSTGFTSNATSGASVSSGNNTTAGSAVGVAVGESGTIGELFSVGSAANYTAALACTGNNTPLSGNTLTINAADTAIVCTFTNTRKSATLTLAKTWVNGAIGDTATVTSTGFTNNATSGASVSSGNNTTTGSSVTVFAGASGTISESFSVGSAANYTAGLACTGNGTPLAGSTLTINAADTAIVCTFTNTRGSATLTLRKTWVNGANGDTATVTSTGFTSSATSGASVSSGNNTTTGSAVGVAVGESGTIGESFSVGSAANYTAALACTGNNTPLSGNTLTINAADTAIVCTFTNTRKSSTLTLAMTWVNGAIGDTATVSSTGFTNNATSGLSVSSGNNTTTGSPVTVFAGASGTISVLFSVGNAGNYTPVIACTGNGTPLAGSTLTINPADTAISCTFTDTRKSATLTLAKTWSNGISGDTATVTSTGFTNNATSGASVSSGNNTTTGSAVTAFAGESGTIGESFSVGSAASYTAALACTGNGTPLSGSTLIIGPNDTAVVCTITNKQGPPAPVATAIIPTLDPALLAGLALLLAGAGAWAARRREMIADADKRRRN